MKEMITHWRFRRVLIACNTMPSTGLETSIDKENVTCGNCKRTKVFKNVDA